MTQRSGCDAAARLDFAHGEPRRARGDDHVGRQQLVELPIELLLEIDPLGPVLLDEVGALDRCRQICRERETAIAMRRARDPIARAPARPPSTNRLSDGFCIRRDIRRDDLQSLRQKQRRPARADDARSDDGDCGEWACCWTWSVLL